MGRRSIAIGYAPAGMFARPLFACSLGADLGATAALARALGRRDGPLRVALHVPQPSELALGEPDLEGLERALEAGERAIEALARALASEGASLVGEVDVRPPREAIEAAIEAHRPDVVVLGAFEGEGRDAIAGLALELARARRVATAVLGEDAVEVREIRSLLHPFDGRPSRSPRSAPSSAIAATRARSSFCSRSAPSIRARRREQRARVGGRRPRAARAPPARRGLARRRARPRRRRGRLRHRGDPARRRCRRGLVGDVAARLAVRALSRSRPLLFVPATSGTGPPREGHLDALDAIAARGDAPTSLRLEVLGGLGGLAGPTSCPDVDIALVVGGRQIATVPARGGRIVVPAASASGSLGLGRVAADVDPVFVIETAIVVEDVAEAPVALLDARLEGDALARVRDALDEQGRVVFAVRLVGNAPRARSAPGSAPRGSPARACSTSATCSTRGSPTTFRRGRGRAARPRRRAAAIAGRAGRRDRAARPR